MYLKEMVGKMKYPPVFKKIRWAPYYVSTCGRFVYSEKSQRFLKVDSGQCVWLVNEQGERGRYSVESLLAESKGILWKQCLIIFLGVILGFFLVSGVVIQNNIVETKYISRYLPLVVTKYIYQLMYCQSYLEKIYLIRNYLMNVKKNVLSFIL
jgi:hypothetical protein